ncbi:MAG: hypothetical protein MUE50_24050, partial [Pirellulaceae bacterium]|nr:hypothetical protein [Pirellulaceae bacterium]
MPVGAGRSLRQMLRLDPAPAAQDKGILEDIFQLANVAREVMCHQDRQNIVGNVGDALALQPIELLHEMLDQQRNIFPAFAQRRQLQA